MSAKNHSEPRRRIGTSIGMVAGSLAETVRAQSVSALGSVRHWLELIVTSVGRWNTFQIGGRLPEEVRLAPSRSAEPTSGIRSLVAKRVWYARRNPNDGPRRRCDSFLAELDRHHAFGHDHGFFDG
jgi:hypothetical protein